MSFYIIDVESDGPVPSLNSMVCFGAVRVDIDADQLTTTFYGQTKPLEGAESIPESLSISGFSKEQHKTFPEPAVTMWEFSVWLQKTNIGGRPIMFSDNLAYDWQWINYYFHRYLGNNPFGYSGRRISDLYCGLVKDLRAPWKHLRITPHTHNPVDDAKGNAEVLIHMIKKQGLKV